MAWEKALIADREKLIKYLSHNEWNHLHFSSVLREKGYLKLTSQGIIYILRGKDQDIRGSLFFSRGGAFHCCFEPGDLKKNEIDQLERMLQSRAFFSFIGRSDRIALIENLYNAESSYQVDYHLFVISRHEIIENPLPLSHGEYTFRRAGKEDFELLYPLEVAYQKEEVLRQPDLLNEKFLKKKFLKQLSEEIIWIGLLGNNAVAKGGTNARGFNYSQIGGVYTLPQERGKGLGLVLMNNLNKNLAEKGWGSSLFVRKDNGAAIALYQKCRYNNRGEFRIVYPD